MTDFYELAKTRFSVRNFAPTPVEKDKLEQILAAGRIAPTAKNNQPQKVYVLQSAEALAKIRSVCPCAYNAPVVLAIGYDKDAVWQNPFKDGVHSGEVDASIVTTHMMLEAWDLGVGSVWVGWFNPDVVHSALELPDNVVVTALLPLGYVPEGGQPSPQHESVRPCAETIAYM